MKRIPVFLVILAAAAGMAVLIWPRPQAAVAAAPPLMCYVGGTMTPVFNSLAAAYRSATGREVEISSADSGELLATIEMRLQGDLYVAHDPFMDVAMRRGLGVNAWRIGELYPVLVVRKGNPKNIHALRDLMRPDVRVFLTDYQYSTLGQILPILFKRAGLDFAELNRVKQIPTHRSGAWAANQVVLGTADAALVWQVVAFLRRDDLDAIPLGSDVLPRPDIDAVTSATGRQYIVAPVKVAIVSLTCSKQPRAVEDFVAFVTSEQGRRIFREGGYEVTDRYGRREYINGVRQPPG